MIRVAIITVSDKGSKGQREDISGQKIREMVETEDWEVVDYQIVPDEKSEITELLNKLADNNQADLILTTGGTGFAARDHTPEATLESIEKEVPGLAEKMRSGTSRFTELSYLSRARAGIRKYTLILNLPGSPKAVSQCLQEVIGIIPHGIKVLQGEITEHE
ncbi:MAG: MogA/MoaB family molybdenum cofactor biosynthesis protein [Bacillota bacterium]